MCRLVHFSRTVKWILALVQSIRTLNLNIHPFLHNQSRCTSFIPVILLTVRLLLIIQSVSISTKQHPSSLNHQLSFFHECWGINDKLLFIRLAKSRRHNCSLCQRFKLFDSIKLFQLVSPDEISKDSLPLMQ